MRPFLRLGRGFIGKARFLPSGYCSVLLESEVGVFGDFTS